MLWDISILKGYAVSGSDGHLGTVSDLLFDDATWKMRWLVVNTRDWFPSREVLLPAAAWGHLDFSRRQFTVRLTRQDIEGGPGVEKDLPVSRQGRIDLRGRHGGTAEGGLRASCALGPQPTHGDSHLRSVDAVLGHRVHAGEAEIGHVDEILVDSVDWSIRYIRVDTRSWRPEGRILIPPSSIREIDWPGKLVHLVMDPRQVGGSSYCPAVGSDDLHDEILPAHGGIGWIKS